MLSDFFFLFLCWFSIVWHLQYTRGGRKAYYLPLFPIKVTLNSRRSAVSIWKIFCTSPLQGLFKPRYAKTFPISNLLQLVGMEEEGAQLSHPNTSWRVQPPPSTDSKAADRQRESLRGSGPLCKEDQNWKGLLHSSSHLAGTQTAWLLLRMIQTIWVGLTAEWTSMFVKS